jgi:hypothetical protein
MPLTDTFAKNIKHTGATAGDKGGFKLEVQQLNWVKAHKPGKLKGADSKPVSAEQMEISRLRADLARVKMERDILRKATAYFARGSGCWRTAVSRRALPACVVLPTGLSLRGVDR